jgi:NADH:ubiquinone oxidoreductase subunit E
VLKPNPGIQEAEFAQAIATGAVVEDGKYYLQHTFCCITCNTATKFTQADDTWAARVN